MQKNGSEIMEFKKGIKDSIPVGLGYFAVSFSLGIIAKNVGLSPIQGFLTKPIHKCIGRRICGLFND